MKFLTPIDKWMVGLFALTSGVVLAEGALSRDVLLQRVERCRRFEHAQDRRDALDALKARSGLSQDEWALTLSAGRTERAYRHASKEDCTWDGSARRNK